MGVKALFRHLCAELDGFYVKACVYVLNGMTQNMRNLFYYMKNVQFILAADVTGSEEALSESDMRGIAAVAGVFPPWITVSSLAGSIRLTTTNISGGVRYNERGLYNMQREAFGYYHTSPSYTDASSDINTLATSADRSTLVGDGQTVIGYVPYGCTVFDGSGNVNESLLESHASDGSYPYYGPQFLYFTETFSILSIMEYEMFYYMYIALQKCRYNGSSVALFSELTSLIMGDYVTGVSFSSYGEYQAVRYSLYQESEISKKDIRFYIWEYVISEKFPQLLLEEV